MPLKDKKFLVNMLCGQLDELVDIVWLTLCLVSRLVSFDLTAFGTAVDYDISLLGVGDTAYWLHGSPAFVGTVTRIYVNVERPQTYGAVITGGVAQGFYFGAAMGTDKSVIVL